MKVDSTHKKSGSRFSSRFTRKRNAKPEIRDSLLPLHCCVRETWSKDEMWRHVSDGISPEKPLSSSCNWHVKVKKFKSFSEIHWHGNRHNDVTFHSLDDSNEICSTPKKKQHYGFFFLIRPAVILRSVLPARNKRFFCLRLLLPTVSRPIF